MASSINLNEYQQALISALAEYTRSLNLILAASARHDTNGVNDALNYLAKKCVPLLAPRDLISPSLRNFFEESVSEYIDVLLTHDNLRQCYQQQ